MISAWNQALDFIDKTKHHFARVTLYILMLTLLVSSIWPDPYLVGSAAVLFFGIFFELIATIYKDIHKVEEKYDRNKSLVTWFSDLTDARKKLDPLVKESLCSSGQGTITWLGVTLDHAWGVVLKELLTKQLKSKKWWGDVRITLVQVDPEFCKHEKTLKKDKDLAKEVQMRYNKIKRWIQDNKDYLDKHHVRIVIYRYKYIPNLHGVLINDRVLFLSSSFWQKSGKSGSGRTLETDCRPYERYELGDPLGSHMISLFNSWLRFVEEDLESRDAEPFSSAVESNK